MAKIQCDRGHTARQCHEGLVEACITTQEVARWVRALNEGRDNVKHMARPGRPSVSEEDMDYIEGLYKFHRYATCILVITK